MKEFIAGGVAFAAVVFIASSCLHIGKHPLHRGRLAVGIILILLVAAFALQVANAPPTPGPTDIDDRPKPAPIVATLQQKFEMDFDAYDQPSWPVAIELATCSSNAYLAPVFAELELKKRGFTDVSTLNFGSSLGYVAMIGDWRHSGNYVSRNESLRDSRLVRKPERLQSSQIQDSPEGKCVLDEWSESLEGFFAHIPRKRWMNFPAANALASRKCTEIVFRPARWRGYR